MTIRIVLEGVGVGAAVVVSVAGNERILLQDDHVKFPLLSRLDTCSYDVFRHDDMDGLLAELALIAPEPGTMADHLADIRRLAERARGVPGATLSFTPFD